MITQTDTVTNCYHLNTNAEYNSEIIRNYYTQVAKYPEKYRKIFQNVFNEREHALIEQLELKATLLKAQITQLKKITSQETIAQLIMKRKQEKQNERAKLSKNWRDLAQKLKKLEGQEKKLQNQNSEAMFDIANLEIKIEQLKSQNCKLKELIKDQKDNQKYRTSQAQQNRRSYISPYKLTGINNLYSTFPRLNKQQSLLKQQDSKFLSTNPIKINPQQKLESQNCSNVNKSLNKKLTQIRAIKQLSPNLLIQFLSNKNVKEQIYQILRN